MQMKKFFFAVALFLLGSKAIDKKHPTVEKIKQWVDKEYENGRVTVISDDELAALVEQYGI